MRDKKNSLAELFKEYKSVKENDLSGRYINYDRILPLLQKWSSIFEIKEIGKSVLGIPLHAIYLGNGKKKILAWSQMHGNESTTTKAIFDFIKACEFKDENIMLNSILDNCRICIIPILNPDGARKYTRVNANGVDLNRDAFDRKEPESRILREIFLEFQPHFCFNMHDQRSIFSAGNNNQPATLSFLTPSMNKDRSVTDSRKTSMQLIAGIVKELDEFIPGKIGRYDDAFNINCTGDTFQSENIPTVLFEAGHFPEDYNREETRKFVFIALVTGLYAIARDKIKEVNWQEYLKIPENEKMFNDIVLRNCLIRGTKNDVAIQFKETLHHNNIHFIPVIEKIRNELSVFGHKEIDCKNLEIKINEKQELCENVIVDKFWVNNEIYPIN